MAYSMRLFSRSIQKEILQKVLREDKQSRSLKLKAKAPDKYYNIPINTSKLHLLLKSRPQKFRSMAKNSFNDSTFSRGLAWKKIGWSEKETNSSNKENYL